VTRTAPAYSARPGGPNGRTNRRTVSQPERFQLYQFGNGECQLPLKTSFFHDLQCGIDCRFSVSTSAIMREPCHTSHLMDRLR
jgi:hypothetical protein